MRVALSRVDFDESVPEGCILLRTMYTSPLDTARRVTNQPVGCGWAMRRSVSMGRMSLALWFIIYLDYNFTSARLHQRPGPRAQASPIILVPWHSCPHSLRSKCHSSLGHTHSHTPPLFTTTHTRRSRVHRRHAQASRRSRHSQGARPARHSHTPLARARRHAQASRRSRHSRGARAEQHRHPA